MQPTLVRPERIGNWLETFQGVKFYLLDPRPEDVLVIDIAHHLSRTHRYNGAFQIEHYSVAEHSVLMANWILAQHKDPVLAYQALMHDATEAYIGDMVRPLKRNMPNFEAIEALVWTAVVQSNPVLRFKGQQQADQCRDGEVYWHLDPRVIEADYRIVVDERAQIMRANDNEWQSDRLEPLGIRVNGWTPDKARCEFLSLERTLFEEAHTRMR